MSLEVLTVDEAKIDCTWAIKIIAIIILYSKIDYLAEKLCRKIHQTHDEWLVGILIKTKVRQFQSGLLYINVESTTAAQPSDILQKHANQVLDQL